MFKQSSIVLLCALMLVHSAEVMTDHRGSPSQSGDGNSFSPVISPGGQHVAFISHANNLVTNDGHNDWLDAFVYSVSTSNVTLVSVAHTGTGGGNGNSGVPSVSSNGQFVAFVSAADNLVANDTNGATDIFFRDLRTDSTRLITRDPYGNPSLPPQTGNRANGAFHLSADGDWIVFESSATNLTSNFDTNGGYDIFRHHVGSNYTELVTRDRLDESSAGSTPSSIADVTRDGRVIALISAATNLGPQVTSSSGDLYLSFLGSDQLVHVSQLHTLFPDGFKCAAASLSDAATIVAITVQAPATAETSFLVRHDYGQSNVLLIATNVVAAEMSSDGRYLVYEDGTNIWRWDSTDHSTSLVNTDLTGTTPKAGRSIRAKMSDDARRVSFLSDSPQITTNAASGFQLYVRDLEDSVTEKITRHETGSSISGLMPSTAYSFAPQGNLLAFESDSGNLVHGDENGASDVFVYSGIDRLLACASRRESTLARSTAIASAHFNSSCVSSNGRYVAVTLLSRDTNARQIIKVFDTKTGEVRAMIDDPRPLQSVSLSGDGRYLLHIRRGSDGGMFRYNIESRTNEFIHPDIHQINLSFPILSPSGDAVAFRSNSVLYLFDIESKTIEFSTNNVTSFTSTDERDALFTPDGHCLIFAREHYFYAWDRQRRELQEFGGYDWTGHPAASVSGNSRYVVSGEDFDFLTRRDLITGRGLWSWAWQATVNIPYGRNPTISGDGRLVAYETMHPIAQICVFDCSTGASNLISLSQSGAFANGPSRAPQISAHGRFIVFSSTATDITPGHTNGLSALLVHDRTRGETHVLSQTAIGESTAAGNAFLAMDGRTLLFKSAAPDLIPGDYNDAVDVFVSRLEAEDSDNDLIEDSWEVAFFGNLARDGAGDFDSDGSSDHHEFLAGTDPTNRGSVFSVLSVTSLLNDSKKVVWTGNPSRKYLVQYKDDLSSDAWITMNTSIKWDGSTATATTPMIYFEKETNRFYRVICP